jgi:hypothetical protein
VAESIAVVKDDIANKWLIVTNPRITPGAGLESDQSERGQPRLECDFVWTGERWSSDWDDALLFDHRESAEKYFQANASQLGG